MYGTDEKTDFDGFVADTFTVSRTFGYKSRTTGTSKPHLMPIIDCINHDYHGSRFTLGGWSNISNGVRVQGRQPIPENRECYPFKGKGSARITTQVIF